MEELLSLKALVVAWSGMDRGALHVLGGLLLLIACALAWRRPLSSVAPWLTAAVILLLDASLIGFADGAFDSAELAQAWRDGLVAMAVPTVLLLLCRYAPGLMTPPPADRRIMVPTRHDKAIVDAEYEEIR